jgi:platelet-activating factor acetylhydrolase IB subunit beta/gamma
MTLLYSPQQDNPFAEALAPEYRDDEHFIERHANFLKLIQETPIRLLFLGDSITRRWVENLEYWNGFFTPYQNANFGVGGDMAQNLLWRIQNGELDNIQPEVIVLLIGTNNIPTHSAAEITATLHLIVATIQEKLPKTKIVLMAIFPRGPQERNKADESNPYFMDKVNAVNQNLMSLDDRDSIYFLDIGASFLGPDGEIDTALLPDRLHLIEPGYQVWGEALKGIITELIKPIPLEATKKNSRAGRDHLSKPAPNERNL